MPEKIASAEGMVSPPPRCPEAATLPVCQNFSSWLCTIQKVMSFAATGESPWRPKNTLEFGSKPCTPGEPQNRWQMDVPPPQNEAIGCAPWPHAYGSKIKPPGHRRSGAPFWVPFVHPQPHGADRALPKPTRMEEHLWPRVCRPGEESQSPARQQSALLAKIRPLASAVTTSPLTNSCSATT